jgi:hypothetical protein
VTIAEGDALWGGEGRVGVEREEGVVGRGEEDIGMATGVGVEGCEWGTTSV